MSVKIFDGYIWLGTVEELLGSVQDARRELRNVGEEVKTDWLFKRARSVLDMAMFGAGSPDGKTPIRHAVKSYNTMLEENEKGYRMPGLDSSARLWFGVQEGEVLCRLVAERDMRDRVLTLLPLEEFHYQNQVDWDASYTQEQIERRKELWMGIYSTYGNQWNRSIEDSMASCVLIDGPSKAYHQLIPNKHVLESTEEDIAARAGKVAFQYAIDELMALSDVVIDTSNLWKTVRKAKERLRKEDTKPYMKELRALVQSNLKVDVGLSDLSVPFKDIKAIKLPPLPESVEVDWPYRLG